MFSPDSADSEAVGQVLRYGQNFRLGITGGFEDIMVSSHVACLFGTCHFVSMWANGHPLKCIEDCAGTRSVSDDYESRLQLYTGNFRPILFFLTLRIKKTNKPHP